MTPQHMVVKRAALVIVLASMVASCGHGDKAAREARNVEYANQVKAAIAARPDVLDMGINYADGSSGSSGSLEAGVTVKPGAPLKPVFDALVRALWLSRIDPLNSMSLQVWDEKTSPNPHLNHDYVLVDDAEAKELRQKFGPRPVG